MAVARAIVSVLALLALCTEAQKVKLRGSGVGMDSKTAEAIATKSGCHGSLCNGVPEDRFAVLLEKGSVTINIGVFDSKTENEKCVTHPTPVACDEDAANVARFLNHKNNDDVQYDDKFTVTVKGGRRVCVRRVDKHEGWGQSLKVTCKDAQEKTEKCMCLTSPEGACSCKGCSEEEQTETCSELLGPCSCQRSDEAICDCSGYCHTKEHRQFACEEEPGCLWSGMWCEAQVGLLWQ